MTTDSVLPAAADNALLAGLRTWRRYSRFRESGVEWLGEIPAHWEVRKVKHLFRVVNGATPRSGIADYWDGDIPWATPDDLGQLKGDTIAGTARLITKLGYESCGTSLVPAGSLVLSTRAPIGHIAIASIDLCTNQGCRALIFRANDDRRYFYYQVLAARAELESRGQGSTFRELRKIKLEAVPLAMPPLPEQRSVATFLDTETSRIDALVAKKEHLIDLLQEKRIGVVSKAVTKGLDPAVPMKYSGVECLGEVPAHWDSRRLRFATRMGTQNGLYKPRDYYAEEGTPIISMAEAFGSPTMESVAKDRVQLTDHEYRAYRLDCGDLLFARRSLVFEGSGKCSMVGVLPEPHVFESSIIRVRLDTSSLEPWFALLFLNSAPGRFQILSATKQVTISGIDAQAVKDIVLLLPPPEEQRAIMAYLDNETGKIDALVAKIREGTETLREYRTALISAAVTGKIDVREEAA
jgi:type I restriction enzyme S subunit